MSAFGIALGLLLGGCGGRGSPSITATPSETTPPSAAAVTPAPSPTPTGPQVTAAPKRQESIAIGDDERVVDLFVPDAPTGGTYPMLVLLHASGESPFVMAKTSRIGQLAAREGLLVALPPARDRRWRAMVPPGDPITPSADVDFVVGLIDRLAEDLPIDRDRVYVAGFSIGAVMSERLACQHADLVAAVALDAGAPWSDECSPSRPVPILVMHGIADGTFRIGLAGEVVTRWRAADGCTGEPVVTQLSDIATSEVNDDCAGGATVQYVRYAGAGHRWFTNPDATEVLWAFLKAQTRT